MKKRVFFVAKIPHQNLTDGNEVETSVSGAATLCILTICITTFSIMSFTAALAVIGFLRQLSSITLRITTLKIIRCWVLLYWVSLCWVPSCWVSLCWVSLCWVSRSWVSLCFQKFFSFEICCINGHFLSPMLLNFSSVYFTYFRATSWSVSLCWGLSSIAHLTRKYWARVKGVPPWQRLWHITRKCSESQNICRVMMKRKIEKKYCSQSFCQLDILSNTKRPNCLT